VTVPDRDRRAAPFVHAVYVGIPVLFLLATAAISWAARDSDLSLNWPALLVPALVLLAALLIGRRQRYRTGAWPRAGKWFGGITGLVVAFHLILLELRLVTYTFPVWAVLGALAGRQLGAHAQRIILVPPVPELADSRYDLLFALRSRHPIRLRITTGLVAVQRKVPGSFGYGETKWSTGIEHPLGAVESAQQIVLSGDEELRTPMSGGGPAASPGPALAIRFAGSTDDWLLPLDQAEVVAAILLRRR
jgi:hypothetical protein